MLATPWLWFDVGSKDVQRELVGHLLAVLSLVEEPVPGAGRVMPLHLLPFGQRAVLEPL